MLELITNNSFLNTLGLTLIHFMWQGCIIALLLKSALMLIKPHHSQLRYAASAIALIASLCVPVFTFLLLYQPDSASYVVAQESELLELMRSSAYLNEENHLDELLSFSAYLSMLWLIGVSYLSCKLLIEFYFVNQLRYKQASEPSDKLLAKFHQLSAKIGLLKAPELMISLSAKVPMAIGWLKPVVIIPVAMVTRLDKEQLEMLMLHELAHVKRYDYFVNIVQTIVEILLFFHPMVHWMSKQMRNEREYCSDDIAIKHCGNPIAYAHTLTDTAALCHGHQHSIPTMAMAVSGGDLTQRVVRIVNHHCAQKPRHGKWIASAIVLSSIALISSQHLITLTLLGNGGVNLLPLKNDESAVILQDRIESTALKTSSLANQLLLRDNAVSAIQDIEHASTEVIKQAINENSLTPIESLASSSNTQPLQQHNAASKVTPSSVNILPQTHDKLLTKTTDNHKLLANTAPKAPQQLTHQSLAVNDAFKRQPSLSIKQQQYQQQLADLAAEVESSSQNQQQHLPITPRKNQQTNQLVAPKLIKAVEPKYPALAKRKGIELEVTVHFTIDEQGKVQDIEFEPTNRITYFRRNIKNAMEQWQFLPATQNGKPVKTQMSKIFSFNLVS
jgi:TonB family protein